MSEIEYPAGMDVIRFGLIGVGKHGRRYALHLRNGFPDLRLVAVARRNREAAESAAAEFGCRAHTNYRELIDSDDVDALIIVVPPVLHVEIVTAAARSGKPVILEKPASARLPAGRTLRAVLQKDPIPLMVAHTLRYNSVVRAILAARERIGTIHAVTLTQRFEPSILDWLDDPEQSGGGITLHTGVHSFDLLRILCGKEAKSVRCWMTSNCTSRTEDSFAAAIRMCDDTTLATISGSRAAGGRTGYIEVAGERGSLIGDHIAQTAHLAVGTRVEPLPVEGVTATVREVLADFTRAIRSGSPMPIPFDEGLRAVAIAEACYAAAASGGTALVETIA